MCWNIVRHAALRGDYRALAYGEMASSSYAPCQDAIVFNVGRTGEPDVAAEHAVCADVRSVAD